MKHTTRMLLIPEDIYQQLVTTAKTNSECGSLKTKLQTVTPIEDAAKRLADANSSNSRLINDDERAILYQKEYKKYQKILADEKEKPLNVKITAANEQIQPINP